MENLAEAKQLVVPKLLVGTLDSPILGGDGNREFLLVLAPDAHVAGAAPRLLAGAALAAAERAEQAAEDDDAFRVVPDEGLSPLLTEPPRRPERKKTAYSRSAAHAKRKEAEAAARDPKL